ncbi:MAG TPA: lipopolysaccharide biosynthesis protein [Steroidobacteraceae bacterium]|jgi:O-antigen/teichoic acid export membrane protein|nr:lipopolysaccharide biosynthesis protein [Steroidobacteraceae bacterium]
MRLYDRSRARRSLFDTIAYRVLSQLTTVLGYIVLVRAMSKPDFGVFNLLYSFIPLVGTVASLGLEQTLRRFQPEYLRQEKLGAAAWLVKRVATARLATNCVLLAVILAVWNRVAPHFGLGPHRVEFEILCVLVILHFQSQILQLSMASHMLHRFSVGSVALLSFGKLVCYSILAAVGALTLRSALTADTISYALVYVFLRIQYQRHCAAGVPSEPYHPPPEERRRLLRYALFNNFNDAGTLFLDSRMDNFFVAGFLNSVAVGIYAFYMRLNEMATNILPVRLFENVIQPMFFAVETHEADTRLPQYFTFLLNTNLLLQWPIVAFAVSYHHEIVRVVFGGKFIEQSWLLPLVLGFSTINCFATPVSLTAQYEEKTQIQLLSKIFAAYNVLAMLVFIPWWGLYGAAIASGSAQALKNLFVWWHVRQRAVWLNAPTALGLSLAFWGGATGICYALKAAIPAPSYVHLGFGLLVFACVGMIAVRSPVLSRTDRELFFRLFQGRETRLLKILGLLTPHGGAHGAS